MQNTVAIIGSGIAGLALSLRLVHKGYRVAVFEKEGKPGGKIASLSKGGFRFDTGPSLFTLPELVDELIEIAGGNSEFEYSKLENICRYFYPDNSVINAYQDPVAFANEIESVTGVDRTRIERYLKKSETIYNLTRDIFIFNDLRNPKNFLNLKTVKGMFYAYKLKPFSTLHNVNKKSFNDSRVVQLFDRYATYNGSNPYKAPATLKVIPHLEHNIGAFFPARGMYNIVETIFGLCKKTGVKFYFNEPVTKVEAHESDRHKVITAKRQQDYDSIVSNVDIMTFRKLVNIDIKKPGSNHQMSTSAIIFYWGVKKETQNLTLHNILFSENYREEFNYLFNKKLVFDDPTIYIFISSKIVKDDAPQGHENWFVMINAPENTGQDWNKLINEAKKNILHKINKILGYDIRKHIVFEQIASPETIEKNTGSFHGSLYGLSSNNMWAAFKRHPNYIKSAKNLYFVGGSVHPGGGIPLCLASAKIVDRFFPKITDNNV